MFYWLHTQFERASTETDNGIAKKKNGYIKRNKTKEMENLGGGGIRFLAKQATANNSILTNGIHNRKRKKVKS